MKLIVLNTLNERILKALKFFLQKFYHIYVVITYTLSLNNFKIFLKIFLIFFYRPKLIISGFQHALTYIALDNTIKCFKKLNIKFFLIDGSLLGAVRNQNADAGSAQDLDIAIAIKQKEIDLIIKNLKKFFGKDIRTVVYDNKKNKIYINFFKTFRFMYPIDISLMILRKNKIHCRLDVYGRKPIKKIFHKKFFFPLKKARFYYRNLNIPNKSKKLLNITYGNKWKVPLTKNKIILN